MPIDPDSRRAREIAEKRQRVVEALREDQFKSDFAVAGELGLSDGFVKTVRRSLPTDESGLIAWGAPARALPRPPAR